MNNFVPFADNNQSLVLTDKHGNELNVENDAGSLSIYGQWQGRVDAPEFVSFLATVQLAQDILLKEKHQSLQEQDGFSLSKKKDEVLLDVDVTMEKDDKASGQILKLLNKVNKLKK